MVPLNVQKLKGVAHNNFVWIMQQLQYLAYVGDPMIPCGGLVCLVAPAVLLGAKLQS